MMFSETADIETSTADYATRFSGAAGEFFLERQSAVTLSLLSDLPGAKVLDVGGGHAQLAEPLIKNGYKVTVTGSADSCRQRLDQRLADSDFEYLTCDSLNLPFEDKSFDVVMAFRLMTHVTKWQAFVSELCRVADKCVIFDYPDIRSSNVLYKQLFATKKKMEGNTRPFTLYSRSQLVSELKKNGYGQLNLKPEFFLPMVVHRKLQNKMVSSTLESCFKFCGATRLFGSPIILKSCREKSTS